MEKLSLSELLHELNALKALIKQLLERIAPLEAENAECRRWLTAIKLSLFQQF